MNTILDFLQDHPEGADAIQGLGHMVRGTGMPAAHLPLPRLSLETAGEVRQVKLRRKRSRVPKPLRYALGVPSIILLGSVGWSRSEADRERILRWMRGR